jgi:biopolymer transport protein ExbD
MAKRSSEEVNINMTPMIDVVFQLIIFFVVTVDLDRKKFDERIKLAFAPDGPAIAQLDPRTIVVEVSEKGLLSIARNPVPDDLLETWLKYAVRTGGQDTPVQIRGDRRTKHEHIRRVMDACGRAGISRVSFVATKEKAHKGS